MTINGAVREYLAYVKTLGRSGDTCRSYRSRLGKFAAFAEAKGVKAVRNVTLGLVEKFHDLLIGEAGKSNSRSCIVGTVASFLAWCHEHRLIMSDIASRIELPKLEQTLPPRPLDPQDIDRLIKIVPSDTVVGRRDRAIIEVLYATGIRRHELLGLNVGDIDASACTVFVRGKGAKDRVVPIHEKALKAVATYMTVRGGRPKKKSPLFATDGQGILRGNRLGLESLRRLFRLLNRKFKKHVHPHLLRHSMAVHLLKNGVDIRYVQAILGHESADTTSKYLGLVKEDIKREYDRAIERILGS